MRSNRRCAIDFERLRRAILATAARVNNAIAQEVAAASAAEPPQGPRAVPAAAKAAVVRKTRAVRKEPVLVKRGKRA